MLTLSYASLGEDPAAPASDPYLCAANVCKSRTPGLVDLTTIRFKLLQGKVNAALAALGLSGRIAEDGEIGVATADAIIKIANALPGGDQAMPALKAYAIWPSDKAAPIQVIAGSAADLIPTLQQIAESRQKKGRLWLWGTLAVVAVAAAGTATVLVVRRRRRRSA